jgi:hypothetical protein
MSSKKSMVDKANSTQKQLRIISKIKKTSGVFTSGVNCSHMPEHPKTTFYKAPCETVYKNEYGASIVLGRDRPKPGKSSGFGGSGHTHCASVDIVVGRPRVQKKNDRPAKVGPLFIPQVDKAVDAEFPFLSDGARIYLSEKTTLEDNFGLVSGQIPRTTKGMLRSAIGIKADLVALMGQEGIKLVTKPDTHNSWGAEINTIPPIEFIAGNEKNEGLEPLVKGDRLVECLGKIFEHLETLEGDLAGVIVSQIKMNAALSSHVHHSPFFGMLTSPSPSVLEAGLSSICRLGNVSLKSRLSQTANIAGNKMLYTHPNGQRYINSRHVHTT